MTTPRKPPRLLTLILTTLLPCALLAARWYSFRAFDYIYLLRSGTAYNVLLTDGTVQLAIASDFHRGVALEKEWIASSIFGHHIYDDRTHIDTEYYLYRFLLHALNEDVGVEIPTHDLRIIAYGSHIHDHSLHGISIGPPLPPPPPTTVRYLQFPLWPWIILSTLLAALKWFRFYQSSRKISGFPIEPNTPAATPT